MSIRPFSAVGSVEQELMASDAWKKSCYMEIEYTIDDELSVYDAVQRMSAFDIGCLVTVDSAGMFHCVNMYTAPRGLQLLVMLIVPATTSYPFCPDIMTY